MDAEFEQALAARAAEVEATLDALTPPPDGPERRVVEAMRHALLGGGKRLRAFLTLESAALFDVPAAHARRAAAAIECVHAYSLVHDDLPAMDDDALRRGKPTCHIAFDEATAILAGDALQTLAFEIAAAPETSDHPARRAEFCRALAAASGARGMVGGQMLDILAEEGAVALDLDEVARLQAMKTGALIRISAEAGAILGGASADARAALTGYADRLGLAFQIADDLLDLEGDEALAGKKLRKDAAAGKATFATLLGREAAREKMYTLVDEAKSLLSTFNDSATLLRSAADFSARRRH